MNVIVNIDCNVTFLMIMAILPKKEDRIQDYALPSVHVLFIECIVHSTIDCTASFRPLNSV